MAFETSDFSLITTLAISVHVPYPRRDIHGNASFPSQFLELVARLTILPTADYAQDRNLRGARHGRLVEELLGPWLEAQERHLVRREVLGADPIVKACERALHDRGA